ncbi:MAG: PKD domain-containing protein [Spirochaetota bacterium]|nr:PKD domain-containing protein [Spirochaetota bacterium]
MDIFKFRNTTKIFRINIIIINSMLIGLLKPMIMITLFVLYLSTLGCKSDDDSDPLFFGPADGEFASHPRIAMPFGAEATGEAIAVWEQDGKIVTNFYYPGPDPSWSGPGEIETNYINNTDPHITMNSYREALLIWKSNDEYLMAQYDYTNGWRGIMEDSESGGILAESAGIKMDDDGKAVIVWTDTRASFIGVWSFRYSLNNGWYLPYADNFDIDSGNYSNASNPQIAMYPKRHYNSTVIVWKEESNIYSSFLIFYDYQDWSSVRRIGNDVDDEAAPEISVCYEDEFSAIVTFKSNNKIYYNQAYIDSEDRIDWIGQVEVETEEPAISNTQVAMDANGNGMLLWAEEDGNIYAKRYDAVSGWEGTQWLGGDVGNEPYPRIASDREGNFIAIWSANGLAIQCNRYDVNDGWLGARQIYLSANPIHQELRPWIAMGGSPTGGPGIAVAVWSDEGVIKSYDWIPPTTSFTVSSSPQVNQPVTFSATGEDWDGDITTYKWDFENDGIIDATGQSVSHTYNEVGSYSVLLRVFDDDGVANRMVQLVNVGSESGCAPMSITSGDPPDGTVGVPYSHTITVSGGEVPIHFQEINGFPNGLTLDYYTGELSGTPTESGSFNMEIIIYDSCQPDAQSISDTYTINIME